MDKPAFYGAVRSSLFGGQLAQGAVDGIEAILPAFDQYGDGDQRKLAYILGTAFHEADRFRTMEEYASGSAYEGRKDLGNTQAGDGRRFKGRGFVQITGRRNYTDWSARLGIGLVSDPNLAKQPDIAARILVEGMMLGTFTGKGLPSYIAGPKCDFLNARRTVNGTDKADLIAGHARKFESALDAAGYSAAPVAVPEPIILPETAPVPTPAPAASAKPLTPIEQMNKPIQGAKTGAASAGLGGAILVLWSTSGYMPEAWQTPEAMMSLGMLFAAVPGLVGSFIAAYRARDLRFMPKKV